MIFLKSVSLAQETATTISSAPLDASLGRQISSRQTDLNLVNVQFTLCFDQIEAYCLVSSLCLSENFQHFIFPSLLSFYDAEDLLCIIGDL